MDSEITDILRYRLQAYYSAVMNHRVHFTDGGSTGDCPAYVPYYLRELVLDSFDDLADEGISLPPSAWIDLARAERLFSEFESIHGPAFRRILLEELHEFVQRYHASLCYACLCVPVDPPGEIPVERIIIGILIGELKKDHDLAELEHFITLLDGSLAGVGEIQNETLPQAVSEISEASKTPVSCDKGTP